MKEKNEAILEDKAEMANLNLWCDELKLENRVTRAAFVYKTDGRKKEWQERKVGWDLNKRLFDAEIWSISEAFKVAK